MREADKQRFHELSKDADHNSRISDDSRCEARIALTLEYRAQLPGPVTRPKWGDIQDAQRQLWDIKSPHSEEAIIDKIARKAKAAGKPVPVPHFDGRAVFDLDRELDRIYQMQQVKDFGVIVDLRRLTSTQAHTLVNGIIGHPEIHWDRIRLLPQDLSPYPPLP